MSRDRDDQVTAREAADHVGVHPDTIDTWVRRGHLQPVTGSGRPRRFWLSDVFAAERDRRTHWKKRLR